MIGDMFGELRREIEALIDEMIQLSYFMRGAVSYDDMLARTPGERQRIARFIERRLESESKSTHPVY